MLFLIQNVINQTFIQFAKDFFLKSILSTRYYLFKQFIPVQTEISAQEFTNCIILNVNYFVPKILSPASPRPGTIYLCSLSPSSMLPQ